MICENCEHSYESHFDKDFEAGICLPCRINYEHEQDIEKDKMQLVRFNNKHNTNYNLDTFFLACEDEKQITIEMCKGFPRMREILKYVDLVNYEAQLEEDYWKERERAPELFDDLEQIKI